MDVASSLSEDSVHLAALMHSAAAAIFSVSMDRRFLSWNVAAERMFGFTAREILGSDMLEIVSQDRREEALDFEARAMSGETFTVDTVRRHRSGQWMPVTLSLAPVRDPQGMVVATCTVAQAVNGHAAARLQWQHEAETRRRTEAALEASVRDFRTFFEMANVGNVLADAGTCRFLRVNRSLCEMTGYTAEELLGMSSYDLTDPEDVARDRAGWEEAIREAAPSYSIEKRYRRKDGNIIWVHVTSTLVRNAAGEPLHAIGVVRDVTDRRQAMEELRNARAELEVRVASRTAELTEAIGQAREAAHRLEALIGSSPLAIVSLDTEARVQVWNPAAERLFGWTAQEVLGRPLQILPDENRAQFEEELRDIVASPERLHWETKRQRRDGSVIDVEAWRVPLFTSEHKVYASTAILMDVTERKFLERALLEAAERESRRIGQELHDHLCQHLLGAAFSAKALAMGLPRDLAVAGELHNLAGLINSAVQQARDIARGLNPVELDAAGLMAALQELTERPHAGIACRLECERNVLLLDAEAALHAYRIAQEAMANAVQHSGATQIIVRLSEDVRNIVLQIEDNGRGFEPRANGHQGLGLEIMKYRAHAISGKVRVNTSLGGGTSVVLVLPK